MSVTASFYKFSKRKNSTKQPTGAGTDFSVDLKSGTSLLRPTLLLSNSSYPDYNYCQFMGMYYFIRDIVSVRNDLWELYLIVDPLATAKADILASTQYVCYSSQSGNSWLADMRIPVLKSTTASKATSALPFINTNGFYVLSVVGGDSGVGGCEVFAVNKSTLNALIQRVSTWSGNDITQIMSGVTINPPSYSPPTVQTPQTGADNAECFTKLIQSLKAMIDSMGAVATSVQNSANDLMKKIQEASTTTGFLGNAFANAPNCIRSCIWVPFDLASFTGNSGTIYLGKYDTNQGGFKVNPSPTSGSVTVSIPWHFSDWRRGVCEDVYLYLPFVGMVSFSADSLTNVSSITVKYSATATDGNVCYEVIAGNEILGTYGGNTSTNYPIGINQQSSAGEVFTALIGGVQKTVSALVESSISPVSTVAALGKMALEIGIAGYDVKNVQNTTHFSCVGGIGGGAGVGLDLSITCYTVAHDTIVNPSDMKDTMGLPTMKPMLLSSLSGYCQCANAHLDAAYQEPILDAVDTYLNSGFFIE